MNTLAENYFKEVDRKFGINNKEYTLSSLEVAEMIGKEHKLLLRDIRRYLKQFDSINQNKTGIQIAPVDFFIISSYKDAKGENRVCYDITRKGCEFIANKLTGQKGTEFTARYVNRFHELEKGNATNALINALNSISESMTNIKNDINARLTKLEEQTQSQPAIGTTYKKPYNPWFAKMQPKYKLLEEYFDITRGQLYKNILWEVENLYDVDIQQIQADYCYENNLTSCYPLEPYEFVPKYRDMIEEIVNNNLIKYGIASEDDPITSTKHITIFDAPIVEKQN